MELIKGIYQDTQNGMKIVKICLLLIFYHSVIINELVRYRYFASVGGRIGFGL